MALAQIVPTLPPGEPGDPGLFGPGSTVWQVARERALLLGGPAAVLLQLAHPLVAAGVADHSDFRTEPLRRLVATMNVSLTITFGDTRQAAEAAAEVRSRHATVTGALTTAQGPWPAGSRYRATDPALALWVFATLVAVGLDAYELFVGPLTREQRSAYYDESAPFAAAFGVRRPVLPASYDDFERYYDGALRELVHVGDLARDLASAVLRVRLAGVPVTPSAHVLAAWLLPTPVRRAYRLPAVPRAGAWPMRQGITRLPGGLRNWPHYAVARRRVAAAPAPSSR